MGMHSGNKIAGSEKGTRSIRLFNLAVCLVNKRSTAVSVDKKGCVKYSGGKISDKMTPNLTSGQVGGSCLGT